MQSTQDRKVQKLLFDAAVEIARLDGTENGVFRSLMTELQQQSQPLSTSVGEIANLYDIAAADALDEVIRSGCRVFWWNGKPYEHVPNASLLAPASLDMERTILGPRMELALAYARENGVNRIEGARDARLGVVAGGKSYYDLMHALQQLHLPPLMVAVTSLMYRYLAVLTNEATTMMRARASRSAITP